MRIDMAGRGAREQAQFFQHQPPTPRRCGRQRGKQTREYRVGQSASRDVGARRYLTDFDSRLVIETERRGAKLEYHARRLPISQHRILDPDMGDPHWPLVRLRKSDYRAFLDHGSSSLNRLLARGPGARPKCS
jgi:hypothetical protein